MKKWWINIFFPEAVARNEYYELDWNCKSENKIAISNRYPWHHPNIQAYNIRHYQTVIHLGTDQAWCRLTSVIRREPLFQRDLAISLPYIELKEVYICEKKIKNISLCKVRIYVA